MDDKQYFERLGFVVLFILSYFFAKYPISLLNDYIYVPLNQAVAVPISNVMADGLRTIIGEDGASPANADNIVSALDDVPLYLIHTGVDAEPLRDEIMEVKTGEVFLVADSSTLPDSCHVLVSTGMYETPSDMRSPGRFLIILPQNNGELTPEAYAHQIVEYLDKYAFKRDDENGTFFNMATFLNQAGSRHSTASNEIDETDSTASNEIDETDSTASNEIDETDSTVSNEIDETDSTVSNEIEVTDSTETQEQ